MPCRSMGERGGPAVINRPGRTQPESLQDHGIANRPCEFAVAAGGTFGAAAEDLFLFGLAVSDDALAMEVAAR